MIDVINSKSGPEVKYTAHETDKYMQIRCTKCKVFAFWFKNSDDIPLKDIKRKQVNL